MFKYIEKTKERENKNHEYPLVPNYPVSILRPYKVTM